MSRHRGRRAAHRFVVQGLPLAYPGDVAPVGTGPAAIGELTMLDGRDAVVIERDGGAPRAFSQGKLPAVDTRLLTGPAPTN